MKRNPPSESKVIGLTTPDLVVLTLLAERPMHGYELNAELEGGMCGIGPGSPGRRYTIP
jgi:DNA-binding PadR family transcriptional regulator